MRRALLFIMLVLSSAASAETPDDAASGEDASEVTVPVLPGPEERLEEAVFNYQTRKHGLAMQQLAALAIDPDIPAQVRQDARVYLGEILYIQGDSDGAKRLFEQVLREEPDYQIDRFRHPPDVCGHFEYVRTYMAPATDPEVIIQRPPPLPFVGAAPFGAYHFKHGNPRRGRVYLVGQALLGATSLSLFGVMLYDRSYLTEEVDRKQQLQRMRVTQVTATVGFYGLWAWSGVDARRHWRLKTSAGPAVGGNGVSLSAEASLRF